MSTRVKTTVTRNTTNMTMTPKENRPNADTLNTGEKKHAAIPFLQAKVYEVGNRKRNHWAKWKVIFKEHLIVCHEAWIKRIRVIGKRSVPELKLKILQVVRETCYHTVLAVVKKFHGIRPARPRAKKVIYTRLNLNVFEMKKGSNRSFGGSDCSVDVLLWPDSLPGSICETNLKNEQAGLWPSRW